MRRRESGLRGRGIVACLVAAVSGCGCLGSLEYLGSDGGAAAGGGAPSCEDVLSDATNCGACGHSCLGGSCSKGKCQPVVVADAQDQPSGIGVDADHVYWSNFGSLEIRRAPTKGGADERVAISDPASVEFVPTDLLVESTRVLWTNTSAGQNSGNALMAWSKAGGDPAGFAGPSPDGNGGLAGDGATFYFTNFGAKEVRSAQLSQGFTTVAMDQSGPGTVAVDATHVYWVNQQGGVGGVM